LLQLLQGQVEVSALLDKETDIDSEALGSAPVSAGRRIQATFLSEIVLRNSKLNIDPRLLEKIDQVRVCR
jgi:hypothetical protein